MDGWESRRRRTPGHDHCILRIRPGIIRGVDIDTRHFTGNYPPEISIQSCRAESESGLAGDWHDLVPRRGVIANGHNYFAVDDARTWTHLKLNLHPDGGIARLRVFGEAQSAGLGGQPRHDLSSLAVGGRALQCNDMHFGHMENLLKPEPACDMGDGWETRRRRVPGNDWVILALGRPGRVLRVEVDTSFFTGNYPAYCRLSATAGGADEALCEESADWPVLLPRVALGPDQLHVFETQLHEVGEVTHVRFDIIPDGGVARLRLYGVPAGRKPTC